MARIAIESRSADATGRIGEALGELARPGDVLLLSGDLGAGKTQLVKGLGRALGVAEPVTSPTFNIMLAHEGRVPLFHVDLYRLDSADQLEDIDYFGTLEAGGVVAVEWGDRFSEAAPPDHVSIELDIVDDTRRLITIAGSGPRSRHVVMELADIASGAQDLVVVGGPS